MNSTGTSINVHSQVCFDIKFSANGTDKIQTICKRNNNRKDKGDTTMNLEKLINICILSVSGATDQIPTGKPNGEKV